VRSELCYGQPFGSCGPRRPSVAVAERRVPLESRFASGRTLCAVPIDNQHGTRCADSWDDDATEKTGTRTPTEANKRGPRTASPAAAWPNAATDISPAMTKGDFQTVRHCSLRCGVTPMKCPRAPIRHAISHHHNRGTHDRGFLVADNAKLPAR